MSDGQELYVGTQIVKIEDLLTREETLVQILKDCDPKLEELEEQADITRSQEEAVRRELAKFGLVGDLEKLEEDIAERGKDADSIRGELLEGLGELKAALETADDRIKKLVGDAVDTIAHEKKQLLEKQAVLTAYMTSTLDRSEKQATAPGSGGESDFEETFAFESGDDGEVLTGAERRRHPRENVSLQVRLEGPDQLLSGSSENVSIGGVFIETPRKIELGTLLHVVCTLPDESVVEGDGVVSWTRRERDGIPAGVGVEFLAMSEQDRSALERLKGE